MKVSRKGTKEQRRKGRKELMMRTDNMYGLSVFHLMIFICHQQ
jgi:hypothetical protein